MKNVQRCMMLSVCFCLIRVAGAQSVQPTQVPAAPAVSPSDVVTKQDLQQVVKTVHKVTREEALQRSIIVKKLRKEQQETAERTKEAATQAAQATANREVQAVKNDVNSQVAKTEGRLDSKITIIAVILFAGLAIVGVIVLLTRRKPAGEFSLNAPAVDAEAITQRVLAEVKTDLQKTVEPTTPVNPELPAVRVRARENMDRTGKAVTPFIIKLVSRPDYEMAVEGEIAVTADFGGDPENATPMIFFPGEKNPVNWDARIRHAAFVLRGAASPRGAASTTSLPQRAV